MRNYTVQRNQSLLDIAVQEYGSYKGVFWIKEDNDLNSIVANLFEGDVILLRDDVINAQVKRKIKETTPFVQTMFDEDRAKGIGFMEIEKTFKVS